MANFSTKNLHCAQPLAKQGVKFLTSKETPEKLTQPLDDLCLSKERLDGGIGRIGPDCTSLAACRSMKAATQGDKAKPTWLHPNNTKHKCYFCKYPTSDIILIQCFSLGFVTTDPHLTAGSRKTQRNRTGRPGHSALSAHSTHSARLRFCLPRSWPLRPAGLRAAAVHGAVAGPSAVGTILYNTIQYYTTIPYNTILLS